MWKRRKIIATIETLGLTTIAGCSRFNRPDIQPEQEAEQQDSGNDTEPTYDVKKVITIRNATGRDTNNEGTIDEVSITVQLAQDVQNTPGPDTVDLTETTYKLQTNDISETFSGDTSKNSVVSYDVLSGEDEIERSQDNFILNNQSALVSVSFDLTASEDIGALDGNQKLTIVIGVSNAGTSYYSGQAPTNIEIGEEYIL